MNQTSKTTRPARAQTSTWPGALLAAAACAAWSVVAMPASAQVVNEDLRIIANDGTAQDFFGVSVAIEGGLMAVGAGGDTPNGAFSGSAYVFDAATGAQISKLVPGDGAANDQFGWSIAIDDGIVAVGAFGDFDNGFKSGSVYLFDAQTGAQLFKLLPPVGRNFQEFGITLAMDDGLVVIGSPGNFTAPSSSGSAYIFNVSTGAFMAHLLADDGTFGDEFGNAIDIGGGIVAVGAHNDADNGFQTGAVYLFNAATGLQTGKVLANDGVGGDEFGYAVAIDNNGADTLVVGAIGDDDNGASSGSAYVFSLPSAAQTGKLLPGDGEPGDEFGWAVDVEDDAVVVGEWRDNNRTGAAYLFDTASAAQTAKLVTSAGQGGAEFALSVSIDAGTVASGAESENVGGFQWVGAGYVFNLDVPTCYADCDQSGTLNILDYICFGDDFANGGTYADCDGSGGLNILDYICYGDAFAAGCP